MSLPTTSNNKSKGKWWLYKRRSGQTNGCKTKIFNSNKIWIKLNKMLSFFVKTRQQRGSLQFSITQQFQWTNGRQKGCFKSETLTQFSIDKSISKVCEFKEIKSRSSPRRNWGMGMDIYLDNRTQRVISKRLQSHFKVLTTTNFERTILGSELLMLC